MYFPKDGTARIGAMLDQFGMRSGGRCLSASSESFTSSTSSDGAGVVDVIPCPEEPGLKTTTSQLLDNNLGTTIIIFNSTGKCLGVKTRTTSNLPSLSTIDRGMLGIALVQADCDAATTMRRGGGEGKGGGEGERASQQPEYLVSFNHQIASNECGDVSYIYDITSTTGSGYRPNGKHLGRYEHSASILSPEDETMRLDSAEYGNLLVYGGRDLDVGILYDIWSYNVRTRQWSQLHDGGGWRVPTDVHLHGQVRSENIVSCILYLLFCDYYYITIIDDCS